MTKGLFVGVLGHRHAGKSRTWNTLFGSTVRTSKNCRALELYGGECINVFLISGSPQERKFDIGDKLASLNCSVVLCSIQYTELVRPTLHYAVENNFDIFVQWLNPGYKDAGENHDSLGLMPWLLGQGATVAMRNGKDNPSDRTEEVRQFIYGWGKRHSHTFTCPQSTHDLPTVM
jgi:hypothetical protein